MFTGRLYIFLGEMHLQLLCSLSPLGWLCFAAVDVFLCRPCVGCFLSWTSFLGSIPIRKKPGLCSGPAEPFFLIEGLLLGSQPSFPQAKGWVSFQAVRRQRLSPL